MENYIDPKSLLIVARPCNVGPTYEFVLRWLTDSFNICVVDLGGPEVCRAHLEARKQPWMSSSRIPSPSSVTGSLISLELTDYGRLGCLDSEPQCPSAFPALGITSTHQHISLYNWVPVLEFSPHTCKGSIVLAELSPQPLFRLLINLTLFIHYCLLWALLIVGDDQLLGEVSQESYDI